ncbi:hypothetical protein LTR47_011128 [Exophiala xenobiotica]|nr:hypothetical protein LTR47_011128 [Exophiala xenobiotica]KAK5252513.1 hypothetical protein LTS06_002920 [Exophiala xenobiotica]KAK5348298.1 hypothetical protein LTR61_008156 [Exophiala xenobiotica]KAK5362796.1 hypothetical protein LTR11_009486 [Exophiala xenobiotica]KAK5366103.1 hypothetical protein LTS03_008862 [Exophiala xenobiotica]
MNAASTKEQLQAKVEEEEDEQVADVPADRGGQRVSSALIKHTTEITHFTNNVALVHFNESLRQAKTLSEQRALVMHNSVNLLKDLLDQWTTLAEESNHVNEDVSNAPRDPESSLFSENPGRQSSGTSTTLIAEKYGASLEKIRKRESPTYSRPYRESQTYRNKVTRQ